MTTTTTTTTSCSAGHKKLDRFAHQFIPPALWRTFTYNARFVKAGDAGADHTSLHLANINDITAPQFTPHLLAQNKQSLWTAFTHDSREAIVVSS